MASCELCGKPATTKARIEGTILHVCSNCASFGTEIKAVAPKRQFVRPEAPEMYMASDFGQQLRRAREKLGLTEEEAAKKLNIKESTLRHFEHATVQPDDATVKKLEKFYRIKLTQSI